MTDAVQLADYKGEFFRVLQQTGRSQTAVMTIGPGEDAGPEETHTGDQIIYVVEGEARVTIDAREHRAAPLWSRRPRHRKRGEQRAQ